MFVVPSSPLHFCAQKLRIYHFWIFSKCVGLIKDMIIGSGSKCASLKFKFVRKENLNFYVKSFRDTSIQCHQILPILDNLWGYLTFANILNLIWQVFANRPIIIVVNSLCGMVTHSNVLSEGSQSPALSYNVDNWILQTLAWHILNNSTFCAEKVTQMKIENPFLLFLKLQFYSIQPKKTEWW